MYNRLAKPKDYWPRNLLLVAFLLLIWLLVSLMPVGIFDFPDDWTILGWPLPFALTAFGVPLIYLLLIGVYVVVMHRRDKQAQIQSQVADSLSDTLKS